MAKQAVKKDQSEAKKAPTQKKSRKILKRRLSIGGYGSWPADTEVTAEIEKAYKDFYKKATGGDPIRPLDWYC